MQLCLRKFDPSKMKDAATCVVLGKRNTGKSVLTKDIMWHKRDRIPAGVVFSATEEGNSFYSDWVPPTFVYSNFDRDALQGVIDTQKKRKKEGTASNLFLILDDCMYDKKLLKDTSMRMLFMNGRHWKFFLLLTAQYCGDIGPDIRSNIDYVFLLRNNIPNERDKLYKNFLGMMPSFASFCQLMDNTTNDYECLVLDNTSCSNNLEDCLFWYKANPARPAFRMGAPSFWRFHSDHYDPGKEDGAGAARDPRRGAYGGPPAARPCLTVTKLSPGAGRHKRGKRKNKNVGAR
jgi:hypothetical protein